ncbi:MAG TPA: FAD-dependent monooxygenase, partial [Paracoccaceae bacterium]|nr:FAD-dependent monooxygenase [Paracoccaceae bacterium]
PHGDVAFIIPIAKGRYRIISNTQDAIGHVPGLRDLPHRMVLSDTFHVSVKQATAYSSGRVFIGGDAAHVHSPVGGRGMNLGIEDAAWAAWAIAEGREGDYSAARLPVARRTIAQTRALTGMVIGASPFVRFARRRLPPVVLRLGVVRRRVLARILDAGRPLPPWL